MINGDVIGEFQRIYPNMDRSDVKVVAHAFLYRASEDTIRRLLMKKGRKPARRLPGSRVSRSKIEVLAQADWSGIGQAPNQQPVESPAPLPGEYMLTRIQQVGKNSDTARRRLQVALDAAKKARPDSAEYRKAVVQVQHLSYDYISSSLQVLQLAGEILNGRPTEEF